MYVISESYLAQKFAQKISNVLILTTIILMALFISHRPALAGAAENFVNTTGNAVLKVVADKALSDSQKSRKFSAVLGRKADMRRIGIFALGPYARKINGSQRSEYNKLVKQFVLQVYYRRLLEFGKGGGKVEVLGSKSRGKEVIVSSSVKFNNGRVLPVKWRLTTSGGYRLFDLNISGVWLTLEQRSVFVSIIKRNNNDIGALLKHLRQQLAGS